MLHPSVRFWLPSIATLALVVGCGSVGLKTRPVPEQEDGQEQTTSELAPEFALLDADGRTVSLDDLLAGGQPAVLLFYRGHW